MLVEILSFFEKHPILSVIILLIVLDGTAKIVGAARGKW